MTEPSPSSHRRLGSFSPRWLAAGGALVLAAVIGVALLLQNGGSACAAPPSTSAKKGKATFFELDGTMGNCSFPNPPANDLFVALGPDQYSAGAACGTYIDVTGPKGKVRVKVIDSCPECEVGHLDLSRTAFKKIADEVEGIVPITYKTVPGASTPGPISVRVKEGSSQYWLAVLIDNHANQLASVKIARSGGSFHTAHREDYNYWIIDSGLGSGPFRIKITDVYGHGATVSGIKLAPGRTQSTTARLSGGSTKVVKAPPPSAHAPSKKKSATPKPAKSSASPSSAPALTSTTAAETAAPIEPPVDLAAAAGTAACG